MITFLEGVLEEKAPTRIVLNVQGVGYEVLISLNSYDRLPSTGERCRVIIHDHIREDAHVLFGFMKEDERDWFLRLLGITGVGPKLALGAMSGLSIRDFKRAVLEADVKRISSIRGVGKKTAERIVVELKDKISEAEALEAVAGTDETIDRSVQDAVLALISLGYKRDESTKMILAAAKKLPPHPGVEELIRQALAG